jgi:hypothetical protein
LENRSAADEKDRHDENDSSDVGDRYANDATQKRVRLASAQSDQELGLERPFQLRKWKKA